VWLPRLHPVPGFSMGSLGGTQEMIETGDSDAGAPWAPFEKGSSC
jgi:hypothetical protein